MSGRERSHGRTMGAALKGFLVKRMQELQEEGSHRTPVTKEGRHRTPVTKEGRPRTPVTKEGRHRTPVTKEGRHETPVTKEGRHRTPVLESRVTKRTQRTDEAQTPSSLSDTDGEVDRKPAKKKEKRKRKSGKESVRTRSVSGSDGGERTTSDLKKTYQINNDIHITIHRGDSREGRECETDARPHRHRSRSRSRSETRSRSRSKTKRSSSRHKSRDGERRETSSDRSHRKRSSRKERKDKHKSPGKDKHKSPGKDKHKSPGEKKRKKVKKEKTREKKKRKKEEDGDVELDENGERIDYNFEEVDPETFAEDGEVTEESEREVTDVSGDVDDRATSGSDGLVATNKRIKVEWESAGSEVEPAPTVEAVVAVSKACRDMRRAGNAIPRASVMNHSVQRQSVVDGVFECDDSGGRTKPPIRKSGDVKMSLKLSETSKSLITSGLVHNERGVVLEDGEVSCSSSSGLSNVSSCSLLESDGGRKERRKKCKKERKKEKKKKKEKKRKRAESGRRRRSVSSSRSRSPKRKPEGGKPSSSGPDGRDRLSRRRRSGSPSGRKRARSPDNAGRWRSPSPRTTRRRSRSPRRRRSKSPAFYQWKQRDQMTRDYRARLDRRSRTPVRERLGRRRSPDLIIDKAALRAAAIKNTLDSQAKGQLPVNLTAEELARLRSGASEDQKQLTEFCKNLMRKPGHASESDDEPTQLPVLSGSEEEGELTDNKPGIVFNIKNAKQVPILTPGERAAHSAVLSNQFPVSSGSHHRKHEEWIPVEPKPPKPKPPPAPSMPKPKPEKVSTLSGIAFSADEHKDAPQTLASVAKELALEVSAQALQPTGLDALPATNIVRPEERIFPVQARPGNIGELVTLRLNAMKRIALNPNDVEAIGQVYDANQKIEAWTSSKIVPGQFHGSTEAKILTREELEGNKRNQCWAKPGQFHTAQPVAGLGMFLLEKMGWKQGTGLGKNNEGPVEPLLLDLKNDRKGLISNDEILMNPGTNKPRTRPIRDLSEKHPISALMELCQRRKWRSPNFVEMIEDGPAHKRRFLYKVVINNIEYQPTMGSQTKKVAKADAANVCLQALGLVPKATGT